MTRNAFPEPESWKQALEKAITRPADDQALSSFSSGSPDTVVQRYPMRITPYFLSLVQTPQDPLGRQVWPDERELDSSLSPEDPLEETRQSPVPGLVHRYPNRVLFLVSNQCAVYCRYCLRKRMVGRSFAVNDQTRSAALDYIRNTPAVREVILSGGDPLMLDTETLDSVLKRLRDIPHVRVLRIHTRMPGVLPARITDHLVSVLKQYPPLYINIQFNHPAEITPESAAACGKLADAGIPLGSQTVLLKGVNDDPDLLADLFEKLLAIRVRPYYLHHPDWVKGTGHFRVGVPEALSILARLQGRVSGMAMPRYVIDLPGGGGKVALLPESISGEEKGMFKVTGLGGRIYAYPKDA